MLNCPDARTQTVSFASTSSVAAGTSSLLQRSTSDNLKVAKVKVCDLHNPCSLQPWHFTLSQQAVPPRILAASCPLLLLTDIISLQAEVQHILVKVPAWAGGRR